MESEPLANVIHAGFGAAVGQAWRDRRKLEEAIRASGRCIRSHEDRPSGQALTASNARLMQSCFRMRRVSSEIHPCVEPLYADPHTGGRAGQPGSYPDRDGYPQCCSNAYVDNNCEAQFCLC